MSCAVCGRFGDAEPGMHELDFFFLEREHELRLCQGLRSHFNVAELTLIVDRFDRAICLSVRAAASSEPQFRLEGDFRLRRCTAGGWLLQSRDAASASYWSPAPASVRRLSSQGHILEEHASEPVTFDLDTTRVEIAFAPPSEGWVLDSVVWRL